MKKYRTNLNKNQFETQNIKSDYCSCSEPVPFMYRSFDEPSQLVDTEYICRCRICGKLIRKDKN